MKPYAEEQEMGDRISTCEELGEVIELLVGLRQLPWEASLESPGSPKRPSEEDVFELWTDRDRDHRRGAEIEPLTNMFLGRRQEPN